MLKVSFRNAGGELDSRSGLDPAEAAAALKEMLETIDSLFDGDTFVVTGEDDG